MRIYYFQYEDAIGKIKTEAFTSKTSAQKRISELKKETDSLKKAMQLYVIGGKRGDRPSNYIRTLPTDVRSVEFDRNNDGMLDAFTFLANKE